MASLRDQLVGACSLIALVSVCMLLINSSSLPLGKPFSAKRSGITIRPTSWRQKSFRRTIPETEAASGLGYRQSMCNGQRSTTRRPLRHHAYFRDFIVGLQGENDTDKRRTSNQLDRPKKEGVNKKGVVRSSLLAQSQDTKLSVPKTAPSSLSVRNGVSSTSSSNNASGCTWQEAGVGGRVEAPKKFPIILVLPGFGNCQSDYVEMLGSQISLTGALNARGFRATVLPIERVEWFNVAKGLLSLDFWRSKSLPSGPGYNWYINRINETITELLSHTDEEHVVLVAHSAGGWLARAYLAEREDDHRVSALVTLGTPHHNEGGTDVTRGVLPYLNEQFPGAHLDGIRYISVAGKAIQGSTKREGRKSAKAAFAAYHQVCGKGDVFGDGVIPLEAAHLPGARQVTLDGVWHSIDKADSWYGSDGNIDRWLWSLCEECDDVV
eukprot:jgi/Bigna1/140348/aug1.55_g15056